MKRLVVLTALLVCSLSSYSIRALLDSGEYKYRKAWRDIDYFEDDGLYGKALKKSQEIYEQACSDQDHEEILKSLMNQLRLSSYIEEDDYGKNIYRVDSMASMAPSPSREIMHSMLADVYWNYYNQNSWRIQDRSYVADVDLKDFRTWDLKRLAIQIYRHYHSSLLNSEFSKKELVSEYGYIIGNRNETMHMRPSLYDFLAHRALDFCKNNQFNLVGSDNSFILDDPKYFSANGEFVDLNLSTTDTLNTKFYALKIYQSLIRFHQDLENLEPLFYLEKERLEFMKHSSTNLQAQQLYMRGIERLAFASLDNRYAAEGWAAYVQALRTRANGYNALTIGSEGKWDYRAAKIICDRVIDWFPSSYGAQQCASIEAELRNKELTVRAIDAVAINKKSSFLIDYRNIDKMYLKFVEYDQDEYGAAEKAYKKKFPNKYYTIADFLRRKKGIHYRKIELEDPGDLRKHKVEELLPELKSGYYYLVAGTDEKFNKEEEGFAYVGFWATNLTYQTKPSNAGINIFVTDRMSGEPVVGAKVDVSYQEYDYYKGIYKTIHVGTFTADADGQVFLKSTANYRNYNIAISHGKDAYDPSATVYMPYYYEPYQAPIVTNFYTDRKIYRPGQEVHYKGIVINQNGDKKSIRPNWSTKVRFFDANYQEIETADVRANDYGSFAGTFEIPEGLRTGQYRIANEYGSVYFNVEEYKRPKFSVEMNPLEGEFALYDLVKATGTASGYAGNKIEGATVDYRISRSGYFSYPYYWLWSSYYSPTEEVAHGTTYTDEKGEFTVPFLAQPDREANPKLLPNFTYTITADITDLNGETHSTSTYVTIGYQTLSLSNNLPAELDRKEEQFLRLKTTNLNGEDIFAKGNLKIQRILHPDKTYAPKKFEACDIKNWTAEEYAQLFPEYSFEDENNYENWEKGKVVFKTRFDTEQEDSLGLDCSSWAPGIYQYTATAKDRNGIEISDSRYFTVFDKSAKEIPNNEILWSHIPSESFDLGDTCVIVLGTMEEELWVKYDIEIQNKWTGSQLIKLSKEQQTIKIPIEKRHQGNFTVHFNAVKHNNYFTKTQSISVPYYDKELDLEFTTFRNKLVPGQKEEWTMTIKNSDGEKEQAELLAALYDASLDEIYTANSFYLSVHDYYYAQRYWSALQGNYVNRGSTDHGDWNPYVYYPYRSYPFMENFGYNISTGYDYYKFSEGGADYDYYWDYGDGDDGLYNMAVSNQDVPMGGVAQMDYLELADEEIAAEYSEAPYSYAWGETSKESTVDKKKKQVLRGGSYKDVGFYDSNGVAEDNFRGNFFRGRGDYMGISGKLNNVQARANFGETAFFYPQLRTDENGDVKISFTIPESLTRWKFLGLAHTKDLKTGTIQEEVVTQKKLMVLPNPPRFMREGDQLTMVTTVSNMTPKNMKGQVRLELYDPFTEKKLDKKFKLKKSTIDIEMAGEGSAQASWTVTIPYDVSAVKWRIVAAAGKHSDGEENVLPILSNRMMVTESLPLPIRGNETKKFNFKNLTNSKGSKTMKHHRYTLEFTSNPAWYALQAMPYMMEYPYECTEQTFTRFYSNAIATHVLNSSPKIRTIINKWGEESPDAFLSNLRKNQELKAVMLEETPWVLDAKSEEQTKRNLAVLLDMNRMSKEMKQALEKVKNAQVASGGWAWFPGMEESHFITRHIVCGMGHLDRLGVTDVRSNYDNWNMLYKAISWMDKRFVEDYQDIKKIRGWKKMKWIGYDEIQYLYARSFFPEIYLSDELMKAVTFYKIQARKYWKDFNLYGQAMIALAADRMNMNELAEKIVASIKDRAILHEEFGMYWKEYKTGYYWYEAPVETQALMIEMFNEVTDDQEAVDELKIWLLKQKQTTNWKTTKQTTEAVYALLLTGSNLLANDDLVDITLGGEPIVYSNDPDPENPYEVKAEAGTGYFKSHWTGSSVKSRMGEIVVKKNSSGIAWGAAYWQYFEDLDKIEFAETNLKLKKELYLVEMTNAGEELKSVPEGGVLHVGDKIRMRIELRTDRNLEYVHMKDMRASGFEPTNVLSTYKWRDGLGYYESTKDAATNFFFDYIPKGTYVFEYDLRVQHKGNFSNGITTIQCMYAPEFTSHSEGIRVTVE